MSRFLLKRLLWMIPSFLGITFVVFAIIKLSPGDPLSLRGDDVLQAGSSSAAAIREYRHHMGLDDSLLPAYGKWMWRLAHADLGVSFGDGQPVLKKLREALPVTVGLSLLALLITYLVAIPVGIYSAVRPGSATDRGLTVGLFMLYSMPSQWVAVMLIVLFGTRLHWLPIQGLHSEGNASYTDLARHLLLPLVCLTYASFASLSRYMRSGMLEVIRQDYIRTARAKGLAERAVILRHALRNSLISVITLLGLTLPALVGGAVIVERIFGLPGMGQLSFEAIQSKDIPVLMGATALAGVLTMLGLLLSDVLYVIVDPRIQVGEA
jgi:peptide/nickel transport system permease protein